MNRTTINTCLLVALLWVLSQGNHTTCMASESSPQPVANRAQSESDENPEETREFVRRYLTSYRSQDSELLSLLRRLGARIVPYMLEVAVADGGKTPWIYRQMGHTLAELEETERENAAQRLFEVLSSPDCPADLARGLLTVIAYLKEPGLVIEAELIELREARPELSDNVDTALIGIRSTQSGRIFAKRLKEEPDELLLRDTAERGIAAIDAGPTVAGLLEHPDWDTRLAAARTLGFIGYAQVIPALVDLLDDPSDVRINWVAAESLGRLGAKSAVNDLKATAANHWHPAVRRAAEKALWHIASAKPYRFRWPRLGFAKGYFEYTWWGMERPSASGAEFVQEPLEIKLYKSTAPSKLEKLSYDSAIFTVTAGDEKEQRAAKGENSVIVLTGENMVRHRRPIVQVPDVALRVGNGWLVGCDRGEWGGELVFVGDDGTWTDVVKTNVNDIFKLGQRYVAVAGLSHLTSNNGVVYELESDTDGQWQAKPWRPLPGAPRSAGKLKSGAILISTSGAGNIILHEDGTFTMGPTVEEYYQRGF